MGYREIIEEDNLNRITEQNIKFLDEISQKMKKGDISIFAGAGLSIASGYVDWKKLLEPISKQLRLNSNIDLTETAQYYKDKFGRQGLNLIRCQKIMIILIGWLKCQYRNTGQLITIM